MFLYAVRISVAHDIAEAWKHWMIHTHIPEVLQTGYFRGHRFGEVIEPAPPEGHKVFLVLYEAAEEAALRTYLEKEAPRLRAAYPPEFAGRFQAERWIWKMA